MRSFWAAQSPAGLARTRLVGGTRVDQVLATMAGAESADSRMKVLGQQRRIPPDDGASGVNEGLTRMGTRMA